MTDHEYYDPHDFDSNPGPNWATILGLFLLLALCVTYVGCHR